MDRKKEKVIVEEVQTKLEKKQQQRRGDNTKAQPNTEMPGFGLCKTLKGRTRKEREN